MIVQLLERIRNVRVFIGSSLVKNFFLFLSPWGVSVCVYVMCVCEVLNEPFDERCKLTHVDLDPTEVVSLLVVSL